MPYTPILATLGYVFNEDASRVLMVHRTARGAADPHNGKFNGLGGKLEHDEDVAACMRREILEEAGIVCETLQLAGTISWPGFGMNGEDWFGFIFRIFEWSGTPNRENSEGPLEWVPVDRVFDLPLWLGDKYFLPMVLDFEEGQFHGVMPYEDGVPKDWRFSFLE